MKNVVYVVALPDGCDCYDLEKSMAFFDLDKAIDYAYEMIKDSADVWDKFTEDRPENISFCQWVKEELREYGEIDYAVAIVDIAVQS